MQATLALREKAMQLLAADTATLAPAANANKVFLVKEPFTPSEASVIGDLTAADFTGSTALSCGLDAQPEGLNPLNNDALITLESPAGGWRWETTDAVNLPQTIYGFGFADNTLATLLGCELLDTPILLSAANQVVTLGAIGFTQKAGSII